MYSFNHASLLNSITLCTLLVLVHDKMPILKLLCEQHSFSCHERYKEAYYTFYFCSFQVKMVNDYED